MPVCLFNSAYDVSCIGRVQRMASGRRLHNHLRRVFDDPPVRHVRHAVVLETHWGRREAIGHLCEICERVSKIITVFSIVHLFNEAL